MTAARKRRAVTPGAGVPGSRSKPARSVGTPARARVSKSTVARGPGRAEAAVRTGEHDRAQVAPRPVVVAIITVSDTRRGADDTSGALAAKLLTAAGSMVSLRAWVHDDIAAIRRAVKRALARRAVDVVVLTGGTGVAARDVTPEAVEPLLDRALPGFGEGFRMRSWDSVGTAAWLSRAGAGVARGRLVVYLPGSSGAVRQALEQLLIPELAHVVRLLGRF